jgi:hypothetical protein
VYLVGMINGYDLSTVESQRYACILYRNGHHFALGKFESVQMLVQN